MSGNSSGSSPACNLAGLFPPKFAAISQREAVISEERTLTYRELEFHTAAVASELLDAGVSRGEVVPIVLERGWRQVVAALGILKAGAAYLPMDPSWPEQRLALLLREVDARVVLVQSSTGSIPSLTRLHKIEVQPFLPRREGASGPMPAVDPGDLAYVIYTSGSTGRPKGVMIDHGSAVNTIIDVNGRFAVSSMDRVLSVSSLSFDLSVYDVFGPLAAGGAVVMPPYSALPDPESWFQLLTGRGVTIWNSVPALMELLLRYMDASHLKAFNTLRLVLLSGDWIPVSLPDRIRKFFGDVEVVSLGGATEASIWSIYHLIGTVDAGSTSIPYGRALSGQLVHVLDDELQPILDDAPGELYIGGSGVARGYWADPVKTAAAFVPDPVGGGRMYRTGDCGRNLPNGEIEFLGRKDQQVKIRGYRIELGEIEATLEKHPDVERAVAIKHSFSEHDQRILAFVAPERGSKPSERILQTFLLERLPAYMIPSAFKFIETVPISRNGKVDRQALSIMAMLEHHELSDLLDEIERDSSGILDVSEAVAED